MRKRLYRQTALTFLLLFALLTEGCGKVAVHEELTDKTEDSVVIRIAWWGGEERSTVTNQVLELYEESHPEVVFETLPYDWDDYFEMLLMETAQGNMPDLVQMDYQYITTYSENGSLADLTPFVEEGIIQTADLDEEILESGKVGDRLTGIALGTAVITMICNPDVFAEAGIPCPDAGWTWKDFADICVRIQEKTGKYGAAMTPVLDINLFHYWVRQHGAELFSADMRSLGYEDDSVYTDYVSLFKSLMDEKAVPDPDSWAAISSQGTEALPVVTGECGMMQEWNNFSVRMSHINDNLVLVTPPLSNEGKKSGLWLKPSMFFSVAETSSVKKECAKFIDWFIHSEEANALLRGERGIPVSEQVRESLIRNEELTAVQRDMFRFADEAVLLCGETPRPEPAGIDGINEAFAETANACFYGGSTAQEAAAEFRRRVNEILAE